MPELLRKANLDFECPGCGYEFHKTLDWLNNQGSIACPGCGDTFTFKKNEHNVLGGLLDPTERLRNAFDKLK